MMPGLRSFQPAIFVCRLIGLEITAQDGFRIYDDLASSGQLNHHVRPELSIIGGDRFLFAEVTMRDHAGQFRHSFERNLAPATSNSRRSQRVDEVARFLLQPLLRFREGLEMLVESSIGGLAG